MLTNIGSFYYKTNENTDRYDFYECGFKTVSDYRFKINSGTFSTILFVILYDIELLFTLPFYFYIDYCNVNYSIMFYLLMLTIFITFLIDIYEESVI